MLLYLLIRNAGTQFRFYGPQPYLEVHVLGAIDLAESKLRLLVKGLNSESLAVGSTAVRVAITDLKSHNRVTKLVEITTLQ